MGFIREPEGVDFVVVPTTLTDEDRREISNAIAEYRQSHDSSGDVREAQEVIRRYEAGRMRSVAELASAGDARLCGAVAAPTSP